MVALINRHSVKQMLTWLLLLRQGMRHWRMWWSGRPVCGVRSLRRGPGLICRSEQMMCFVWSTTLGIRSMRMLWLQGTSRCLNCMKTVCFHLMSSAVSQPIIWNSRLLMAQAIPSGIAGTVMVRPVYGKPCRWMWTIWRMPGDLSPKRSRNPTRMKDTK